MDNQQWLEGELSCKTLPLVMERGRAGLCWHLGKVKTKVQTEWATEGKGKLKNWQRNPDSQCFYHHSYPSGRRAQPALGSWCGALSKCQHGAVQGQCLRLLPKTPLGRGWEEREAARPRISTNCVLWGLTGGFFFSHCVFVPPKTDQGHSPGSWEPGELLSSGSVHGGKISDYQLAVVLHDWNSGDL